MKLGELTSEVRRGASTSMSALSMHVGSMPRKPASRFGIKNAVVFTCVIFAAMGLSAQSEQVFKGDMCLGPEGRTPVMKDGQASLPCTIPHPKRGAQYILFNSDNKTTYQLSGHIKPKEFAGKSVVVVGILDQALNTIYVDDVRRALPAKITQAQSVYIDCNACPRGMAAAWQAAFESLEDWGRFDVVPDPKKADLIFLFAANPYLGDYVTRDGPDKRGVAVDITYMNVVDPKTGENLWGDSRQWGSLFVAKATRDLLSELKLQMEEETQKDAQSVTQKHRDHKAFPGIGN